MLSLTQDDLSRTAVANLAKAFGTDPDQTKTAATSIAAALGTSMQKAALSRGGLADLVEIIGAPGRDAYLKPDTPLKAPQIEADGIGILSQLLGSRDQSRAVAARAAQASGLSPDVIKSMLPSVAAVLMGALSNKTQAAFGDILKIPGLNEIAREARDDMGGGGQLAPPQYGSPLPLPGEPPRRYSPTPNPDWTASTGRPSVPSRPPAQSAPAPAPPIGGGGMLPQQPLPIPGDVPGMGRHEDNPYGDLSDILRRGGFRIPGGTRIPQGQPGGGAPRPSGIPDEGSAAGGGDLLTNIIRNILGSVLGGGGRGGGILSWIIRFILLRFAAKFLPNILRRIFGV